jgi:stress-induced morphogen
VAEFNLWINADDWTVRIPDEDLEGLDELNRERMIDAWLNDEVLNKISAGWKEIK